MSFSPEAEEQLRKVNEAMDRQAWERQPIDVFSDLLDISEDYGVVRLVFRCSRPEINDPLGGATVVVSRVSMPWHLFKGTVRKFQEKMAKYDAATDAADGA